MSFPLNPSNGEEYTNSLGTIYRFVSSDNAWVISRSSSNICKGVQGITGMNGTTGANGETGALGLQGLTGASISNISYVPPYRKCLAATQSIPANKYRNITGLQFYSVPGSSYRFEYSLYFNDSLKAGFTSVGDCTGIIGANSYGSRYTGLSANFKLGYSTFGGYPVISGQIFGMLFNTGTATGVHNLWAGSTSIRSLTTLSYIIVTKLD